MKTTLNINQQVQELDIAPGDTLLQVLRRLGYYSVKHGCETGECGACAILLDGKPVNSCLYLAAQAEGHTIQTIESLGQHPEQGWKITAGLHPLQKAFVESGAIQCGYCTPAQILAAKELLDRNPNPSETEVREALSGVLCRCTGYLKPVQAVLRAAAVLRGEQVDPVGDDALLIPAPQEWLPGESPLQGGAAPEGGDDFGSFEGGTPAEVQARARLMPRIQLSPETQSLKSVGKPEVKVDAVKLVQGKPAFAADIEKRGMLIAKVLLSTQAHARIRSIDASQALALPGVAAVLTWHDLPRVVHSTAGQSDPIPGPLDTFSLDNKVRFVGDRVAFVAAETEEIANKADAEYLIQGTIYPDRIESGASKNSDKIKSHHNVAGLPEKIKFKKILEPLRDLYKDEVRKVARMLELPKELVNRQPFPGPGLAVRIIGPLTEEKIKIAKRSDKIVREEIEKCDFAESLWQYFSVVTDTKATGVKGDARAYGYVVAVRAMESREAMTASFAKLPYQVLEKISTRITNEVPQVTRVVYDVTHKPPATIEWE